jgi:hypothetical protein
MASHRYSPPSAVLLQPARNFRHHGVAWLPRCVLREVAFVNDDYAPFAAVGQRRYLALVRRSVRRECTLARTSAAARELSAQRFGLLVGPVLVRTRGLVCLSL